MKKGYYDISEFSWAKVKEGDVIHSPTLGWGSIESFLADNHGMYVKIRYELPNILPSFVRISYDGSNNVKKFPTTFDKIGLFSKQIMFKDED